MNLNWKPIAELANYPCNCNVFIWVDGALVIASQGFDGEFHVEGAEASGSDNAYIRPLHPTQFAIIPMFNMPETK